jgi:hypothetical protein
MPVRLAAASLQAARVRAADIAPTIDELRAAGVTSLRAIAAALSDRGIPTASGAGEWQAVQASPSAGAVASVSGYTMRPFNFKQKPQMTSAEFSAALREAGFHVDHGRIVDVSGRCPDFATLPSFNNSVLNRNATLSKVLWEREAEIKRRRAGST